MRPHRAAALSLGLAATVLPLSAGSVSAAGAPLAAPTPVPACGNPAAHAFPIRARLRGGPGTYRAGGGAGTWYVDLTNTTSRACRNVHPVIVVTGSGRDLKAAQVALRLSDAHGTLRSIPLRASDEDEIIGVLDKDTTGFTVPARGTVTLDAVLAFADGAASGEATVSAAVVQREGSDGGWVGESDPYRFTVIGGHGSGDPVGDRDPDPDPDRDGTGEAPATGYAEHPERTDPPDRTGPTRGPGGHASAGTASGGRTPGGREPALSRASDAAPGFGPVSASPGAESEPEPKAEPTRESTPHTGSAPASAPPGAGSVSASPGASPAAAESAIPHLAATGAAHVLSRTALSVGLIAAGAGIVVLVERRRTRRP